MRKLSVEIVQPLCRRRLARPCAASSAGFTRCPDSLKLIENIIALCLRMLNARAINASLCTVKCIYHKRQFLAAKYSLLVILQKMIRMFFALNLADKHLLPAEPVYILFETAGHRID